MKILALDPANACGFAHSDGHYGVWNLTTSGTEHAGRRLNRLADLIRQAHSDWGFERIVYEDASFGGINQNTKAKHNQLAGIIWAVACYLNVPCEAYKPTTIKKFATGSGNAKKPQMIAALKTRLGIETTNDNIADALWILELAKSDYHESEKVKKARQRTAVVKPKQARMF
jgi:Holliday junction resolvasome RuvABC endonuclease subunit